MRSSWKPQVGKEWLPDDSPDRELDWSSRMRPRHLVSVSYKEPTNFMSCDLCFEEAVWYCEHCKINFCRFQECKRVHEDMHRLARLGGD